MAEDAGLGDPGQWQSQPNPPNPDPREQTHHSGEEQTNAAPVDAPPHSGDGVAVRRRQGEQAREILDQYADELPQQLKKILARFKGKLVQEKIIERDAVDLGMYGVSEVEHASRLYETMTLSLQSNPTKFPQFVSVLESFPTLKAIAKEIEQMGKVAGLQFDGACFLGPGTQQQAVEEVDSVPDKTELQRQFLSPNPKIPEEIDHQMRVRGTDPPFGLGSSYADCGDILIYTCLGCVLGVVLIAIAVFILWNMVCFSPPSTCKWHKLNSSNLEQHVREAKSMLPFEEILTSLDELQNQVNSAIVDSKRCNDKTLLIKLLLFNTTVKGMRDNFSDTLHIFSEDTRMILSRLQIVVWDIGASQFTKDHHIHDANATIIEVCKNTGTLAGEIKLLKEYLLDQVKELQQLRDNLVMYKELVRGGNEQRLHELTMDKLAYSVKLDKAYKFVEKCQELVFNNDLDQQGHQEAWDRSCYDTCELSSELKDETHCTELHREFLVEMNKRVIDQNPLLIKKFEDLINEEETFSACFFDAVQHMEQAVNTTFTVDIGDSIFEKELLKPCLDLHAKLSAPVTSEQWCSNEAWSEMCSMTTNLVTKWNALFELGQLFSRGLIGCNTVHAVYVN